MSMTNARSAVQANPRALGGRLRYLAGKIAPRLFGAPLHVQFKLYDPATGAVRKQLNVYNTVTTVGKQGIADQILAAPTMNKPTHMAVGTGTGGTTALNAELDRNALTSKTRSGAIVTMVGDWAAGDATGALTEAGVLTAASSGDLWLYTTYAVVNKGANDALQITWTLTIA
jgi:hypothetical protein